MGIVSELILVLVPMILSLTVHEYAHAWSALKLGDDTALREGRLTLNPAAHIDPFGTLILPAIAVIMHTGFFFGWARPVPVVPARFRRDIRMSTGMAITASAGPISNVILAVLCAVLLAVALRLDAGDAVVVFCGTMIRINVLLAVFNLIPIPPLDGSRVVSWLLSPEAAARYNALERYSFFLIIGVLFVFGNYLHLAVEFGFRSLLRLVGI